MKTVKDLRKQTSQVVDSRLDETITNFKAPGLKAVNQNSIPSLLTFRRRSVRQYPDGQAIVLYYSTQLDKYMTVPFGPNGPGELAESAKRGSLAYTLGYGVGKGIKGVSDIISRKRSDTGPAPKQKKKEAPKAEPVVAAPEKKEAPKAETSKPVANKASEPTKAASPKIAPWTAPKTIKRKTPEPPAAAPVAAKKAEKAEVEAPKKADAPKKTKKVYKPIADDPAADKRRAMRKQGLTQYPFTAKREASTMSTIRSIGSTKPELQYGSEGRFKPLKVNSINKKKKQGASQHQDKNFTYSSGPTGKLGESFKKRLEEKRQEQLDEFLGAALKAAGGAVKKLGGGALNLAKKAGGAALNLATGGDDDETKPIPKKAVTNKSVAVKAAVKKNATKKGPEPLSPAEIQRLRASLGEEVIGSFRKMTESDIILSQKRQIGEDVVKINKHMAKKIIGLYESINEENQQHMLEMLGTDGDSFKKVANFALRY